MAARVASPGGEVEDAEIADLDDCLYAVQFTPKEPGIHIVSVRHKDIHIPGSPFQVKLNCRQIYPIFNFYCFSLPSDHVPTVAHIGFTPEDRA